ncbi:unnamed protein product [Rotaria socialis]|uniref:Uncharacterized protein n=1 Tax=Rotaria socialis TaxID=392032 RepID=A0A818DMD8_9BILA|nr:unnamed protein product [Rotaria socialis]
MEFNEEDGHWRVTVDIHDEVWYTFVDPYATEVDARGSDDFFRCVGVLNIKNVFNENLIICELHIGDFEDKIANVTAKVDYFVKLDVIAAIDHDYWFLHSSKDHVWSWAPEWNNEKYEKKYKIWPARKYITESILPNSALKDVIDARQRGYRNITDLVNHQSNHDYDRLLVDLG